jgi:MFS family permease
MPSNNIKMKINNLYLGIFILAISEAIIAYAQSSYLNKFFNLSVVSLIFIVTYALTFFVINEYPNLIARFNNFRTAIASLLLKIASLIIFVFSAEPALIFAAFIIFTISFTLTFINFDIFLEAFTGNEKTGRMRGVYFTSYNLGWLFSPFLSGLILDNYGFGFLFAIDISLALLVILVLIGNFREFENHFFHKKFKMLRTMKEIFRRKNIKKILAVSFILHFFYAVMIIYMPIYLNQYIGLAWSEIGLIFTIMLIPFVLLQYPAGYIADKYMGEKEMLTAGLVIMSLASLMIFYFNTTSIIIWALILFFSRVGASLAEIMRETYFFKKVDVTNIELINALRSITPLSYIIAPLIIGLLLYFLSLNYIFLILGLVVLTGLYPTLTLKDTK